MKKKILAVLCVSLLLASMLSGCGEKDASVSCLDIVKACSETAGDESFDTWTSYGEDLYKESFDTLYGVRYDMISDGAILYTENGGKADEISILRLSNNDDISITKEKMQSRIDARRQVFAGYKPEEVSKLDSAIVMIQGNYVALIIAEDPQLFETEIRRVISEGGK